MEVPQGSILTSLLWYIMYNGVLAIPGPEGPSIVDFADDRAVVVTSKRPEDVQVYATKTVRSVRSWLEGVELTLSDEKTETALIKPQEKEGRSCCQLSGYQILGCDN